MIFALDDYRMENTYYQKGRDCYDDSCVIHIWRKFTKNAVRVEMDRRNTPAGPGKILFFL